MERIQNTLPIKRFGFYRTFFCIPFSYIITPLNTLYFSFFYIPHITKRQILPKIIPKRTHSPIVIRTFVAEKYKHKTHRL